MVKPVFTASTHSYKSPLGSYTSVTTFLHALQPEKDWDTIVKNYIRKRTYDQLVDELSSEYKKPKSYIISVLGVEGLQKGVKRIWKEETERACEDGTRVHNEKENNLLGKTSIKTKRGTTLPVGGSTTHVVNLADLPDGVYPEMLIWNNDLMIAGQSDLVTLETIDGVRYCFIGDYKTNKKIDVNYNYIDKSGNPVINSYLKAPLDKFCDCNYWIYQLQLNVYAWLLGKFGYKFGGGAIIHVTDNNKVYPLLDLQQEIETLMAWRRKQMQPKK